MGRVVVCAGETARFWPIWAESFLTADHVDKLRWKRHGTTLMGGRGGLKGWELCGRIVSGMYSPVWHTSDCAECSRIGTGAGASQTADQWMLIRIRFFIDASSLIGSRLGDRAGAAETIAAVFVPDTRSRGDPQENRNFIVVSAKMKALRV